LRLTLVITEVRLTEGKTNLGKCRAEAFSGYHLLGEGLISLIIIFIKKKKSKAQRPLEFNSQIIFQNINLHKNLTSRWFCK